VKSERRVEGLDGFASQLGAGVGDGGLQVSQIPARHTLPVHVAYTHTHREKARESERQIEM